MKLTVDAMELKRALRRVRTIIGPKPRRGKPLPITSYAKLEVQGGKATLTGVKSTGLSLVLPIHVEECSNDGACMLPVRQILGILRGFGKHDQAEIEVDGAKLALSRIEVIQLKSLSKHDAARWDRMG